jgi:hypothetical protein
MKRDSGKRPPSGEPDDDDGVDVTLIRWMLSLTPAERLRVLERHVNAVHRLRAAMRAQTRRDREDETPEDGES